MLNIRVGSKLFGISMNGVVVVVIVVVVSVVVVVVSGEVKNATVVTSSYSSLS
jgi:hypothetical protein